MGNCGDDILPDHSGREAIQSLKDQVFDYENELWPKSPQADLPMPDAKSGELSGDGSQPEQSGIP